jgi:ribosomal protein L37AE/L43A
MSVTQSVEQKRIICPKCGSGCVRGRLKTKDFVCVRCAHAFKHGN